MAQFTVQEVRVAGGSIGEEGRLVFVDGTLIALLVKLDTELAEEAGGTWYLEAGFGPISDFHHPSFLTLDNSLAWMRSRLK